MRKLTLVTRRRFGQGLGASLALASAPGASPAHDGSHVVEVRISRFAFVPKRIEIAAGDTVLWINDDLAPHTATARDGAWQTATLEHGSSARVIFDAPGDMDYVCAFHPHMTGTVSVRSKPAG